MPSGQSAPVKAVAEDVQKSSSSKKSTTTSPKSSSPKSSSPKSFVDKELIKSLGDCIVFEFYGPYLVNGSSDEKTPAAGGAGKQKLSTSQQKKQLSKFIANSKLIDLKIHADLITKECTVKDVKEKILKPYIENMSVLKKQLVKEKALEWTLVINEMVMKDDWLFYADYKVMRPSFLQVDFYPKCYAGSYAEYMAKVGALVRKQAK